MFQTASRLLPKIIKNQRQNQIKVIMNLQACGGSVRRGDGLIIAILHRSEHLYCPRKQSILFTVK